MRKSHVFYGIILFLFLTVLFSELTTLQAEEGKKFYSIQVFASKNKTDIDEGKGFSRSLYYKFPCIRRGTIPLESFGPGV